jgi:putative heme iron utilization protein
MGKESAKGTAFYSGRGLVAITIYVSRTMHRKLIREAKKEGRTMQKMLQRVLRDCMAKL